MYGDLLVVNHRFKNLNVSLQVGWKMMSFSKSWRLHGGREEADGWIGVADISFKMYFLWYPKFGKIEF